MSRMGARGGVSPRADARHLLFAGGWVALAIALVSPLHPLGSALFSAHMVQHEILMMVAAPLLVLSRPLAVFLWALPMRSRVAAGNFARNTAIQTVWRQITNPWFAWTFHAAALWVWHVPKLFEATLESESIHSF